jgi:hypothetical protein
MANGCSIERKGPNAVGPGAQLADEQDRPDGATTARQVSSTASSGRVKGPRACH